MDLVFILVGKPTRLINRSDVAQIEGKDGKKETRLITLGYLDG